jgi:acyl-CoA synthetase (NDP forming)
VPLVADHTAAAVIHQARALGRRSLLEPDGYAIAADLGIATPAHVVVSSPEAVTTDLLAQIPGHQVVIKTLAPDLPHKSACGAVATVEGSDTEVRAAIATMVQRLSGRALEGFLIAEHIPHSDRPGAQLLLGMRNTPDLGPIITVGHGGVLTELLSGALDSGRASAVFAPRLHAPEVIGPALRRKTLGTLLSASHSGTSPTLTIDAVVALVLRPFTFAKTDEAQEIAELEFNPVVSVQGEAVALDALVRLTAGEPRDRPRGAARPVHKIDALLRPQSAAIIGVSKGMNPGRVILENMMRAGFPPDALAVVKPGEHTLAGVRCYPKVEALPEKVDLCVVSLAAPDVPTAVEALVHHDRAESIVIVSGGIGERTGTEALAARIRETLAGTRSEPGRGPIVNGANCLGIRSVPGRYDATFIPPFKRPAAPPDPSPLAIVAQSGAFMVSRTSKLLGLNPRYLISVGNQVDLTVGDYLTHLRTDPAIRTVACYLEGFQPDDGRRWLQAAAELVNDGRDVIVYRAGRTIAGGDATVSHTAAVAGDYAAFRELAASVGVLVADTLEDFDDLVRLHCYLATKHVGGMRLGALSNAGFECVAAADHLGPFTLARLSADTETGLGAVLDQAGLGGVVVADNPVDTTPILEDAAFAVAVEALLADDGVDVGVVGCVPLTPALQTLVPGPDHDEDLSQSTSVVQRLAHLHRASSKAWVVVVDAGPLYDVMVERLLAAGVPVFRTMDRALAVFARYCMHRRRDRAVRSYESIRPPGELCACQRPM